MALCSLYCADVPLRNCSLTHSTSQYSINQFIIIIIHLSTKNSAVPCCLTSHLTPPSPILCYSKAVDEILNLLFLLLAAESSFSLLTLENVNYVGIIQSNEYYNPSAYEGTVAFNVTELGMNSVITACCLT